MTTQEIIAELELRTTVLKLVYPGISFGYIGNIERWGDDRRWMIFLPPDPGKKYSDSVGTYSTAGLATMLEQWGSVLAAVDRSMKRKQEEVRRWPFGWEDPQYLRDIGLDPATEGR